MRLREEAIVAGAALIVLCGPAQAQSTSSEPTTLSAAEAFQQAPPAPLADTSRDPRRAIVAGRMLIGAGYKRIYDISVVGGELGLALDIALREPVSIYVTADFFGGTRGYGLGVQLYRLGAEAEYRLHRLRFGMGLGLGVLTMDRATQAVPTASFDGASLRALVSYDLAQWGHWKERGAFLAARLQLDVPPTRQDAFLWGPSVDVGLRF